MQRYRILDTPVDAVSMEEALHFVEKTIDQGNKIQAILAVNPEKVFQLREKPFLKSFFEEAGLLIPDGIGIAKALDIIYNKKIKRCPGADLMQNICELAAKRNYRVFLFGSSEDVNKRTAEILPERYPGLTIVGRSNGFIKSKAEDSSLINKINASQADILFVAMGSPKQENWVREHINELKHVMICQCIGGTLDTIAGKVKRAPDFFQKIYLEWFFRLLCQPKRFKRQINCLKFMFEVFRYKLTRHKEQMNDASND